MTPQHTLKVRIDKQIVDVACPPFVSEAILDRWLEQYKTTHPGSVIISKSWRSDAA